MAVLRRASGTTVGEKTPSRQTRRTRLDKKPLNAFLRVAGTNSMKKYYQSVFLPLLIRI